MRVIFLFIVGLSYCLPIFIFGACKDSFRVTPVTDKNLRSEAEFRKFVLIDENMKPYLEYLEQRRTDEEIKSFEEWLSWKKDKNTK